MLLERTRLHEFCGMFAELMTDKAGERPDGGMLERDRCVQGACERDLQFHLERECCQRVKAGFEEAAIAVNESCVRESEHMRNAIEYGFMNPLGGHRGRCPALFRLVSLWCPSNANGAARGVLIRPHIARNAAGWARQAIEASQGGETGRQDLCVVSTTHETRDDYRVAINGAEALENCARQHGMGAYFDKAIHTDLRQLT